MFVVNVHVFPTPGQQRKLIIKLKINCKPIFLQLESANRIAEEEKGKAEKV